ADGAGAGETASELCDITDAQALRVAFSSAEERFGPVDGVVHAAGVLVAGALLDDSLSEEDFARAVDVNLKGTWLVGREAGRRMRERGRGSLVLVTSNAAT